MNKRVYSGGAHLTRNRVPAVLILIAGLTASGSPKAEPGDETHFFTDIPVGVTVSRMMQPASQSGASMTVIDQDMILSLIHI